MQSSSDGGMNCSLKRGSVIFVYLQRIAKDRWNEKRIEKVYCLRGKWPCPFQKMEWSHNRSGARVKTNEINFHFSPTSLLFVLRKNKLASQFVDRYCNSVALRFGMFLLARAVSVGRVFHFTMCFSEELMSIARTKLNRNNNNKTVWIIISILSGNFNHEPLVC